MPWSEAFSGFRGPYNGPDPPLACAIACAAAGACGNRAQQAASWCTLLLPRLCNDRYTRSMAVSTLVIDPEDVRAVAAKAGDAVPWLERVARYVRAAAA